MNRSSREADGQVEAPPGGSAVAVSVITAAYNAAPFIDRAIESLRAQTRGDWELIVVDDCSTDGLPDVVLAHAARDSRIRLIMSPANAGPSRARNRAIAEARGAWIAVLDADDAWRPERLERLLDLAEAEGADVVADNLIFYDDHAGEEVGVALVPGDHATRLSAAAVIESERPWPTFRHGLLKPMVKLDALRRSGVQYDEGLRYAEDFLFLTELMLSGLRGALTTRPMYVYTMQHNSAAGRRSSTSRSHYDPRQRLAIAQHLVRKYPCEPGSAEGAALARFVGWMSDLCAGYEAVHGVRSRRPASIRTLLATPPRALATYLVTTPTWKRVLLIAARVARPGRPPGELRQRLM